MKFIPQFFNLLALAMTLMVFGACQQPGKDSTGSEFIPDMAHSTAYEANVLTKYDLNTWWDEQSAFSRRELSQPRLPVAGTVARGYAGSATFDGVYPSAEAAVVSTMQRSGRGANFQYTPNGHVSYAYPDTEDGRNLATKLVRYNPFPITKDGLAKGKELYNIYCGICHGDKGDGNGYLVRDDGGKYPAQPANMVDSAFTASSNGRFYHAIVYGKNAMGAYADKLSFEERWQVIHYIRSLQAAAKNAKYDEKSNTLNSEYGLPMASVPKLTANPTTVGESVPAPTVPAHGMQEHTSQSHGTTHENH